MLNLFKAHLSQSTAHGVSNIFKYDRLSIRIFWCFLTVLFVSGFIGHSLVLIFHMYDETVHVSSTPSLPFLQPDVVFCFFRPFSFDYIKNPPSAEYEFMKSVSERVNKVFSESRKTYGLRFSSYQVYDTVGLRDLRRAFFHREEQLVVRLLCSNQKKMKIRFETNFHFYSCLRVPKEDCILRTRDDFIEAVFYMHTHSISRSYNNSIDTRQAQVFYDISMPNTFNFQEMSDGVWVFFAERNYHISRRTSYLIGQGRSGTIIKINPKLYEFRKRKKFTCLDENNFHQYYNLQEDDIGNNLLNFSDRGLCQERRTQLCLYEKIRCVTTVLPIPISIPKNVSFCFNVSNEIVLKNDSLNAANKTLLDVLKERFDIYKNCYFGSRDVCSKEKYCSFFQFDTDARKIRWPSDSALFYYLDLIEKQQKEKQIFNLTPGVRELMDNKQLDKLERWKENLLQIKIERGEPVTTEVTESFAYSFSELFSDIGGIFGFYLGASVLTVFELCSFIHEVICRKVDRKNKEKTDTTNDIQCDVA